MEDEAVPEVLVTSISFGEDVINIQYAERRKQSHVAGVAESMVIEVQYVEEQVAELQELAAEIIDAGLLLIRNPPKKVRQGRRFLREAEDALEEDDDDDDDE